MRKQSITIRPATPDDTAFILSLVPRLVECPLPNPHRARDVLAATRRYIEAILATAPPAQHFFIGTTADGWRTGFLHLASTRDFLSGARECHVSNLVVARRYEGCGTGRALLAYAEAWAKVHRCTLLTLNVFPGNARARALYEHAGFTPDMLRLAKPTRRK